MRLSKRQLKRIIREEYTRLKRRGLIKESYGHPNFDSEWPIDDEGMPTDSLEDCVQENISAYFNDGVIADLEACGVTNPSDLDNCASLGCSDETCEAVENTFEELDKDGSGHWEFQDYTKALYDAIFAVTF